MTRYYTNGLEIPDPKAHKNLAITDVQAAFSAIQDRGKRNHEAQERKAQQGIRDTTVMMWSAEP
jgi:hypothetical protein